MPDAHGVHHRHALGYVALGQVAVIKVYLEEAGVGADSVCKVELELTLALLTLPSPFRCLLATFVGNFLLRLALLLCALDAGRDVLRPQLGVALHLWIVH